jgi:hypothetical protein
MHQKRKKTTWWPLGGLIVKKKTFPSGFKKRKSTLWMSSAFKLARGGEKKTKKKL